MTSENDTAEGTIKTEPKCELVHVDSEGESSSGDENGDSDEPMIIDEQLKSNKSENISISSDDEDALEEQELVEEEQTSSYQLRRRTKRPIKQVLQLFSVQFNFLLIICLFTALIKMSN